MYVNCAYQASSCTVPPALLLQTSQALREVQQLPRPWAAMAVLMEMLMLRHRFFLNRFWLNIRRLRKLPLLNRAGEENKMENLWAEVKTRRYLTNYSQGQNRHFFLKSNLMYCQLKKVWKVRNKLKTPVVLRRPQLLSGNLPLLHHRVLQGLQRGSALARPSLQAAGKYLPPLLPH